ncbi:hypothetical protein ACQ4PT_012879 [Festuca glaucescens]
MASFSCREPNLHAAEIPKPYVTAPGKDGRQLAHRARERHEVSPVQRHLWHIHPCPLVSSIVALLHQVRPKWSPMAIKSVLMTTVYNMDSASGTFGDMSTGNAYMPLARGPGHVDPNRALNPSLYGIRI